MWTCVKCQRENTDMNTACEGCGAVKSAGRFSGSRPMQDVPSPTPAPIPRAERTRVQRLESAQEHAGQPKQYPKQTAYSPRAEAPRRVPAPDEQEESLPRAFRGALTRLVGGILCVLLPALCVLLAWRNADALTPVMLSLFFDAETVLPDIIKTVIYWALALVAALVCLLPGLWTVALGRMCAKK